MRQLLYTMFITNNHALFQFWWKEILVKLKVSKYYDHDCRLGPVGIRHTNFSILIGSYGTFFLLNKVLDIWGSCRFWIKQIVIIKCKPIFRFHRSNILRRDNLWCTWNANCFNSVEQKYVPFHALCCLTCATL